MSTTTITLRLREDLLEAVRARAVADDVSVSEWVRRAIEAYLEMGPADRLLEVERRLGRLEEVAGL